MQADGIPPEERSRKSPLPAPVAGVGRRFAGKRRLWRTEASPGSRAAVTSFREGPEGGFEIDARFEVDGTDAHAGVLAEVSVEAGRTYRIRASARGSQGAVLELNDRSARGRPILHSEPLSPVSREVTVTHRPSADRVALYACMTTHGGNPPGWVEVEGLRVEPLEGARSAPDGALPAPAASVPALLGAGNGSGMGEEAFRFLRRAYHAAPLGERGRSFLKAVFYGVYGVFFPKSERYQIYREHRELRRRMRAAPRFAAGERPLPLAGAMAQRPADVFVFPVIDWHFRLQRPQHLARQLAARGHRVFYFSTSFVRSSGHYEPEPWFVDTNVCLLSLPCPGPPPAIYRERLAPDRLAAMEAGLETVRKRFGIGATLSVVDHPFWWPLVERLPNNRTLYDCMDHHAGFSNTGAELEAIEESLIAGADLVTTTSGGLARSVGPKARRHVLLRNAGEYSHFAEPPAELAVRSERPVIGYYGAIAEWFDSPLLSAAARALPECDFVLVGSTVGADLSPLEGLPNVRRFGETTYETLPAFLHGFDVCTIPFRLIPLTLSTNPVKVYEYLSAGKPVVATPLPELTALGDLVRTADGPEAFVQALRQALADRSPEAAERRRRFARENTWDARGEVLEREVRLLFPRMSVVILTHGRRDLTRDCLESIERHTAYPDWELVLVDNGSTDGTPDLLRSFAFGRPWVRVIACPSNLGFAAGNNLGARASTGEHLVFLNNDTYVTRGWLGDLAAHFLRRTDLGIICPVTNNIGNEARIDIAYSTMEEMETRARAYTASRKGQELELRTVPFFCAAVPRRVWEQVGELDEGFGLGFFEDDDYSMRVRAAGLRVACAEDVFIHHHLSASFREMDSERRRELFERNRRYFETKWGPWTPHRYRTG